MPSDPDQVRTRNAAIARQYLEVLGTGDLDALLGLTSPDARFWVPDGGPFDGAQLRTMFTAINAKFARFPHFTETGITIDGGRVAVEATGEATMKGGAEYRNRYHFLFEIDGDRITAVREYADSLPARVAFFGDRLVSSTEGSGSAGSQQ